MLPRNIRGSLSDMGEGISLCWYRILRKRIKNLHRLNSLLHFFVCLLSFRWASNYFYETFRQLHSCSGGWHK